ncbi:hypothetical protein HY311_02250 [Candidatus Nomurabacteria bacterium]|nr:hypothetical protein [Candidatus Nomurabacteria bacterium]
MKRDVLNSPRLTELKKRRQKAILNKILISFACLAVIFFFLVYLSRLSSLQVGGIEVSGNKVVDTQSITDTVQKEIAGKYLWLFPKSDILIYPEGNIKNNLQNKFTRLKNISLFVGNDKVLKITVDERTPSYIWCGAEPQTRATGAIRASAPEENCYFMDAGGYIFDVAPYFSGEVYFKFYGTAGMGAYFSKQNFQQLVSFMDILVSLGLKPVALYKTADGDMQIFLSGINSAGTSPKILLRADADLKIVAENLQAALDTEPLLSKFKNNYSKLQYIDLRFRNKVYDKFQ